MGKKEEFRKRKDRRSWFLICLIGSIAAGIRFLTIAPGDFCLILKDRITGEQAPSGNDA